MKLHFRMETDNGLVSATHIDGIDIDESLFRLVENPSEFIGDEIAPFIEAILQSLPTNYAKTGTV